MDELDAGIAAETPDAPRPLPVWNGLIGMDGVLKTWRGLVKDGRLPPTMLVIGRDGIGKRPLLAALAAMHVCETGVACGACEQCRWLLSGSHPEVLWLEGDDGKLRADAADLLQEHIALSAQGNALARIAVLVDADQLTLQAANRLLKTLEEPPPRVRLLLSTSRSDALPNTILSRCVKWRIQPPTLTASRLWLAERLESLGQPREEAELDDLLKRSGMAPGKALALATDDRGAALPPLFGAAGVGAALQSATAWAKDSCEGTGELLARAERELNAYYASCAARQSPPRIAATARIRDLLRGGKALALKGKVPLSAPLQMAALARAGAASGPLGGI